MQRFLELRISVFLLLCMAAQARGQPGSMPLASCAWVRAENDAAGAGFIVDAQRKLLITCRHLVADHTKVDVFFPWYRDGKLISDRQTYLRHRTELRELGLLVTGTVRQTSDERDLALVELESLPKEVLAVAFAASDLAPGMHLLVIGNRLDLETVWNLTTGSARVSGRLADGYFWRGNKLAVNASVVIGQLPTEEGDSGGPVFNPRGELIGMVSALRRQTPEAAIIISAQEIRRFAGMAEPIAYPPRESSAAEKAAQALMRATVWVQPTATDVHRAGVLVEDNLVLTCGQGLHRGDRVGVAFPVLEGSRWVSERSAYVDPVALALAGCWRSASVLATDPVRELALLRLESIPPSNRPLSLSKRHPVIGDRIHAMNHPSGLEFAWVYASGTIRQRGRLAIAPGGQATPISVLLCQLPAQSGSPGGPIVGDSGELLGMLSTRESMQQVGYVVTAGEIAAFLDNAPTDRPPQTLPGLFARAEVLPDALARATAVGLAQRAEEHRQAGRSVEARLDCERAVALDPACVAARLCRARMLPPEEAIGELDRAVEAGNFNRVAILLRAELAASAKDWRKARGDLEHILAGNPLDAEARLRSIGVLLELHEDQKALAAVSDTLRADQKRLPELAGVLLAQADWLAKKFPDAPGIAAEWLLKAVIAAEKVIGEPSTKRRLSRMITEAKAEKEDHKRLSLLRAGLGEIMQK